MYINMHICHICIYMLICKTALIIKSVCVTMCYVSVGSVPVGNLDGVASYCIVYVYIYI